MARKKGPRPPPPPSAEPLDSTDELPQEQSKTEPLDSTDELPQEQSKTEPLDSTSSSATIKTEPLDSTSSSAIIKIECKPAIDALKRGEYTEALRVAKEVCLRHKSSAYVHHIQSSIYIGMASKLDDNSAEKQVHLKNAVESCKQAVLLSPKSIMFRFLYASALFEVKCYGEVIRECDEALSIDNPSDPAKDTMEDNSLSETSPAEGRISEVNKKLMEILKKLDLILVENINKTRQASMMAEEEQAEVEIQERAEVEWQQPQKDEEKAGRLSRLEKRRKDANLKNIKASASRTEQLQSYFKSMSNEKKLGLLQTRICDLRAHLSSFKDQLAEEILSEAVGFNEKNNTWKFWACCFCDDKFVDSASHLHHLKQNHTGRLSSKLESVVPVEVHVHQVEMLVNGRCKPVDTLAVVKMIESQSKCPISDDQKWPLSDDSERVELLERIHDIVQLLLKHKYLAESHLNKLMEYTEEEVEKCVPALQLLIQDLGKPPHSICFLGASQLKTILQFLQELADVCALDTDSSSTDDANQGCEINEGIAYTGESLRLLLRDGLLRVLLPLKYDNSVSDDDDDLLCFLFGIDPIEERLASWTDLCRNTKHQGKEAFQELETEWRFLQFMYEEKRQYLSRGEEAFEKTDEKQMKGLCTELSKIDARLMRRISADMKPLEIELAQVSANDYQFIMLPLLRTFIRVQLEDLVDKDAIEKAEAASEALLRELELDDEKKGGNQTKHQTQDKHKKSKNKKKKKHHRKLEATGVNKQQEEQDGQQATLKQSEELQRKQLTEQNENTGASGTIPASTSTEPIVYSDHGDDGGADLPSQVALEDTVLQSDQQINPQGSLSMSTTLGIYLFMTSIKKSHEELVNREAKKKEKLFIEAKKKEKEQLNKVIQELMDRTKGLNKESQELMDRTKEVNQDSQGLMDVTRELNKESQQLMDRTKELNKESQQLMDRTKELNKESQESMNRIQELNKESQELMDRTKELNKESQESMDQTKEKNKECQDLMDLTRELNKESQELMDRTKELNKASQEGMDRIQEGMDRVKELDKEIETSTS